jgi:hypothetical protein
MDQSTIVAGLGLILRRMQQLTDQPVTTKEELDRVQQEAPVLQEKWERLMFELRRGHHHRNH